MSLVVRIIKWRLRGRIEFQKSFDIQLQSDAATGAWR